MKYAKIIDGVVVQTQPNAQEGFIQVDELVHCGMLYDGEDFSLPVIPAPPPRTRFSSLEFLERFTEPEQIAVATATMSNAEVKLWYDKLLAAEFIDITDLRVELGIDALVSAGLLAPARKADLLQPGEAL